MPAVFVHGNPETAAIWSLLIPELARDDVITLSPPGFGAPVPPGFGATRIEYVDWLAAELAKIDEPVDLVGHDWGAGHVLGLVSTRPEQVRSWACDCGGLIHPDYVWHDMAQVWQTEGAGEEAVDAMLVSTPVEDRTAAYMELGMTAEIACDLAAAGNEDMARSVLSLYRSAAQPVMRELGELSPNARVRPGRFIFAELDHYCGTETMAREAAARMGAEVSVLSGVGHWWMVEDPAAGAAVLNGFWAELS
jgi:pimeloyl-ACP methyl ester carboxylesterase